MGELLSDLPFFGKYMETQATVYTILLQFRILHLGLSKRGPNGS